MTPALSDLVTAKSKLPAWMVEPVGVVIPTRTREAIPGQAFSGASSSPTSSPAHTPTWKPSPQIVSLPQNTTAQPAPQFDWKQVHVKTVSIAVAFGLTGILLIWAWFPLLNGVYRDLGFQTDSVALTVWSYILGCFGFGFFRAYKEAKGAIKAISASAMSAAPLSYASTPMQNPIPVPIPSATTPWPSRYTRSTPQYPVTVVGSRARHIYHKPSCEWARRISARNKLSFATTTDAQAAGYRRCGVCLP
jgi:Metal binding domain of Ada